MPSPLTTTTTANPRGNRPMLAIPFRPRTQRRGVTLVEMLVVVALVVLMMTILVQIFQATTGTMQASRTIQELDLSLRLLDQTIRQDLQGATARFTPPLNPVDNRGYFEYGENAFADVQGEDGDDYLAFTTRAPEGQVFTGRQWLTGSVTDATGKSFTTVNQNVQPTTITSRVAEVIYFLRNGNLYRRTFLVVPEREKSISAGTDSNKYYRGVMFGQPSRYVSWLGMNDISARPAQFTLNDPTSPTTALQIFPPIPNSLGHLTNRENRAFRPRFANDFSNTSASPGFSNDNKADDNNGDGIPDYYPTLYYDGKGTKLTNPYTGATMAGWAPNSQMHEGIAYAGANSRVEQATTNSYDVYAFPFIYPGMYSVPDPATVNSNLGWIHHLYPALAGTTRYNNHNPLETGDDSSILPTGNQTWFGFPTWRETMRGLILPGTPTPPVLTPEERVGWTDPVNKIAANSNQQPFGLRPFDPTVAPNLASISFPPRVQTTGTKITPYGYDLAGSNLLNHDIPTGYIPDGVFWEDDLIMTNVRSFDIKAFDPDAPLYRTSTAAVPGIGVGYYDLGYSSNPLLFAQNGSLDITAGLNVATYNSNGYLFQNLGKEPTGFGHEGRIPALSNDGRLDPRRGTIIGDDSTGVIRLRRVFDTWSTDYTNAPEADILLNGYAPAAPVYPAFPAPYPSGLRGIQIQIRVADPRNEKVKVLTIRQDFTDKL